MFKFFNSNFLGAQNNEKLFTVHQEHLINLSILRTESDIINSLNIDELINYFPIITW